MNTLTAGQRRERRHPHALAGLAFGAGPYRFPGDLITRMALVTFLSAFFRRFPSAHLLGPLEWDAGTLAIPRQTPVALTA